MSQIQALIGEQLGSFRIESVLGSGAMGVVYRATHEKSGRAAAVKVVSGEIPQGGKVQKRFEREAEILRQFNHPGIVRFLAWGRFRGTWYIAMEFVQGMTLDKYLQKEGALSWRKMIDLGIQTCDALHYAHERGVIHRDLKPSNLMITPEGAVKLADFGIAKDLDKTALTATGRTLGTAAYMAPEQIRGTPAVSHKTDLYALGAVFYQMLAGRPPFEGNSPVVLMHYHINEPPPRPSAKVHEVPRALDDLVVAMMAKAPADRPWDAAAVQTKLVELREKAERGANIAMVWPVAGANAGAGGGGDGAPGDGGASGATADRPRRKTRKAGLLGTLTGGPTLGAKARASTAKNGAGEGPGGLLGTIGLLAALLLVGGLIVYLVWPPGQETLYQKARELMASTSRAQWLTARDEYFEPLARRFPASPHLEEIQRWRDQILLDEAEGRARILAAPTATKFSEPKNNAERQFVITNAVAADSSKRRDDLTAIQQWEELAGQMDPNDPEQRPWHLVARHRARQLENAIRDRRQFLQKQFQIAKEKLLQGRAAEAYGIHRELIEKYAGYTDLRDVLPPVAEAAAPLGAGPAASASPPQPAPTQPPAKNETPAPAQPSQRPRQAAEAPGAAAPKEAAPPGPADATAAPETRP